jgi:hypothetical protein
MSPFYVVTDCEFDGLRIDPMKLRRGVNLDDIQIRIKQIELGKSC